MTFNEQAEQPDPASAAGPQPSAADAPIAAAKPKRTGLIAGISAVALVAVAVVGGGYALTASGGSGAAAASSDSSAAAGAAADSASDSATASASATSQVNVEVPKTAGALTLMTNSEGDSIAAELRSENSNLPGSTLYGAYEKTGATSSFADLIVLELSDGDATSYEDLYTSTDANSALLQINSSSGVTDYTTETSAEPNGAMICGNITYTKSPLHACTWIDAGEYGMAFFSATVSDAQAATYSAALWKASEQS